MASTTRFCARIADYRYPLIASAGLILAGCSQLHEDFGFHLERLETRESSGKLDIVVHQTLKLSGEAREALNNGVPLSIRTDLALRPTGSRHDIQRNHREFEIRYLPLSDRYQLTSVEPFSVQTFPRLRHCLAELAAVRFEMELPPGPVEQFDLTARSLLDRRHIPPPMRLPVWFSSRWQHDSGWQTWTLAQTLQAPGRDQAAKAPRV